MEEDIDFVEEYNTWKSKEYSTEEALDKLVSDHEVLLRGSAKDSSDNFVRPTNEEDNRLCATNLANIAILNAVFSKEGNPKLQYPYYIDEEHPMELKIYGINENTICERGTVFVLTETDGFLRMPMGSW